MSDTKDPYPLWDEPATRGDLLRALAYVSTALHAVGLALISSEAGDRKQTLEALSKFQKEAADINHEAMESRVYARLDKVATKGSVWGAAATVLGIVLAALAFASDRFDSGLSVQSALEPALAQQRQRDAEQDRKLDEILSRLPPRQPQSAR